MFIYKKTLFDINNEYRKQFNLENIDKQIMCFVELVSNIINIFIEDILKKNLKNVSYLERDNIVFKNYVSHGSSGDSSIDIEKFMNRDEGHYIVNLELETTGNL